mmetsp:Transcript_14571/g.34749  ORF Transcript_14571/g.34749 Transcript_14571/m.34749 type:complete len:158 (-) Transcript_14571:1007-1480(-)
MLLCTFGFPSIGLSVCLSVCEFIIVDMHRHESTQPGRKGVCVGSARCVVSCLYVFSAFLPGHLLGRWACVKDRPTQLSVLNRMQEKDRMHMPSERHTNQSNDQTVFIVSVFVYGRMHGGLFVIPAVKTDVGWLLYMRVSECVRPPIRASVPPVVWLF